MALQKIEKLRQLKDVLLKQKAQYHKSCRLKFAPSKLSTDSGSEMKSPDVNINTPRASKRLSSTPTRDDKEKTLCCFFL